MNSDSRSDGPTVVRKRRYPHGPVAGEGGIVVTATLPTQLTRQLGTWGLMIASAMQAADALIANVALPQLDRDLGAGIELGAWVLTSYLCAAAVMAPLSGGLRRRHGTGRLFPAAVGIFVIASLLCTFAPSAAALIIFRLAQGAGAGLILPIAQAILLDIYPKERHGRILAVWGAVLMLGPILGPLLGGIVTDLVSWRAVFAINLPLGIIVILLVRGLHHPEETARGQPIDVIGTIMLMIGVGTLELALERSAGRSWLHSPELASEASIAVVAFAGLALRTRCVGFSIFRMEIFKDVNFSVAASYNFMTSGLLFVAVVFIPALGEQTLGYTATLAGFTIVPRAVLMMMMMLLVGRVIGKIDYRLLLGSGWLLMAGGLMILSMLPMNEPLPWIIIGSTVQAIGAGMLFTPHSTLAFSTLPTDLRTDASGLYSLLRQLGLASGIALMTGVWRYLSAVNLSRLGAGSASVSASVVNLAGFEGYSECFRIMAIASLALMPGIFLFRLHWSDTAANRAL